MEKISNIRIRWIAIILVCMAALTACRKTTLVESTTDAVNMTNYFKTRPETFSELSKVLKLSETASFLNAYGSYTFFAPTNDAIKEYLQEKGKTKVEDVPAADWKDFIRFHLLEDSIPTSRFTDGKLPNLTMYGQYLVTSAVNTNGVTVLRVNRQADIIQANISVGNGIIHVINHPLKPATQTLAQLVESNPDYSIFTQALKATGLYDALNYLPANNPDTTKRWLTFIAETNASLKTAGFADFAALKAKYSNTGNPTLATDSLNLFMKYHILYDAKYQADIIVSTAHTTLAPLEVLTSKLDGQTVLMNDDIFNNVHEIGFSLVRDKSDQTASNGVLHEASAHFGIKVRYPYPVYWDVCDVPEIRKMTSVYKKTNYPFSRAEIPGLANSIRFSSLPSEGSLQYLYGSAQGSSSASYNRDVLQTPIGTTSRPVWVEFHTPLLVRGRYKLWCGYYVQAASSGVSEAQAFISSEAGETPVPLSNSRLLSFTVKRPGSAPDVEEAIGWKIYMETTSGTQSARLLGIVDIPQTGRYWLRLQAVNGSQNTNNIDMLQFIPVNMDQQYPKFKPDGTPIPRP
ncbi:putative surface protein with fasciclin (FAS1) repeats [Mucilaginibacter yixingensis]|uniref:Putative surface protein with fasciclin (FAS1) repeats n=1 Tax=Mucilaginibacter yixingensis TaxID=1295612 RepID=A0A2T5JG78_9SPHI|nr:fasciclin domain-containing protein [Mucilaginibacter yixingensis]PTR01433.1 putative surface protein with fasciclin (FAS1) repeats [Mucilaginibacter yixingensis]